MGLDMYLDRKIYFSEQAKASVGGKPLIEEVESVTQRAFYWRKANAVHGWFVDNIQGGEDDCKRYSVGLYDLDALESACIAVLENPAMAEDTLPTTEGFFFGGTEVDDYYFDTLRETVEFIKKERENHKKIKDTYGDAVLSVEYEYQSSW